LICQAIGIVLQELPQRIDLTDRPLIVETEKYDTAMWILFAVNFLAEVFVVCDEYAIIPIGGQQRCT